MCSVKGLVAAQSVHLALNQHVGIGSQCQSRDTGVPQVVQVVNHRCTSSHTTDTDNLIIRLAISNMLEGRQKLRAAAISYMLHRKKIGS